jgi:hypothetical protein
MSTSETALKPFELDVRERAAALGRRARWNQMNKGLRERTHRVKTRLHGVRLRLRRVVLEWGAVAHSSATLAGVRRDANRVGHAVRKATSDESGAVAALAKDLGRVSSGLKKSSLRAKTFLMRSGIVSGLAIDSKRVARRVRDARESRRGRHAHP